MFKHGLVKYAVFICSIVLAAVGCSSAGTTEKLPSDTAVKKENKVEFQAPQEPVTFKVASSRTKASFEAATKAVRAKYPNVTLEYMTNYKQNDKEIEKMVAAGDTPDIIDDATTNAWWFSVLDVPLDLEPFVKQFNIDLSNVDQPTLNNIRSINGGKLVQIPQNLNPPMVLFYNKDIFDKFGVPYPKVGNTWDDDIELAKRLSRTEGGTDYRGLTAGSIVNRMQLQLAVPYFDQKTGKSVVATDDGWKKLFQTWKSIFEVPGNYPKGANFSNGVDDFIKTKNLAMFPHFLYLVEDPNFTAAVQGGLKWGATTWPSFKENPGVGVGGISGGFMISRTNKYPEFAFQVMMTRLSDEGQIDMAKIGMVPSVNKQEIRAKIYEDTPIVHEIPKDVLQKIYDTKYPPPVYSTRYDTPARGVVNKYLTEYFTGKTDLNTALREADEGINKLVEDQAK
jgi:multiple sugar transport system substrate-binding protein